MTIIRERERETEWLAAAEKRDIHSGWRANNAGEDRKLSEGFDTLLSCKSEFCSNLVTLLIFQPEIFGAVLVRVVVIA